LKPILLENEKMIAELIGAGKEYQTGDQTIVALQPTNLKLNEGELTLIIGPSGSGKITPQYDWLCFSEFQSTGSAQCRRQRGHATQTTRRICL
jgi:ABC-type lipoprotein export system ATPase subunit